jgi:tRNA threonylcarbamoyladenosine biosynthesis protein TsaB
MKILALDTSGPVCSVAIFNGDKLCYEARAVNKKNHSRSLMPMVEEALDKSGLVLADISLIAAVAGPGSFTGVRIGVAAAQGMARGLGISCVAVNALEAMARSIHYPDAVICPIRDARAGQVYGAAFLGEQRLIPDTACMLPEFLNKVLGFEGKLVFLGDGAAVHREKIIDILCGRIVFLPPHLLLPGASSAALIAFDRQENAVDPGLLMPLYLRAPQAERLREKQHGRD